MTRFSFLRKIAKTTLKIQITVKITPLKLSIIKDGPLNF